MYLAIRRYQLTRPAAVDELVRRVMAEPSPTRTAAAALPSDWAATEWGFAPLVSRTPGFEAYYLVDVGQGVVLSISAFADRAGAETSTREAAEWVSGHLADLVQGSPEVLTGEVVGYQTRPEASLI
jgi:hypothetical protein